MSVRLKALNKFLRYAVRPFVGRSGQPEDVRRLLAIATRVFLHGPRVKTEDRVLNGVPALEFIPPEPNGAGTVLYFHGGAYVAGSPWTHRAMLSVLAVETGLRVIAPAYRLAPEQPFPAAFEDAVAIAASLDPSTVVLGGDSAGGGLALALLAREVAHGRKPAGCFAFSPWTDLASTGASLVENAEKEVLLPVKRLPELIDLVLAGGNPVDARISPLYADFHGAPPVSLYVGLTEILRDDTLRMRDRLKDQGCSVKLDTLPNAPHVWQLLVGIVPEARASLGQTASFIRSCLTTPSPRS